MIMCEDMINLLAYVNCTSLEFPMHCKVPSAIIPIRSHRTSASSIECAARLMEVCFELWSCDVKLKMHIHENAEMNSYTSV